MSSKYKVKDNDNAHFVTITTVGWIGVFTRLNHKITIIDSKDDFDFKRSTAAPVYFIAQHEDNSNNHTKQENVGIYQVGEKNGKVDQLTNVITNTNNFIYNLIQRNK